MYETQKDDATILQNVIHFNSFVGTFPLIQKYKIIILITCHLIGFGCFSKAHTDFFQTTSLSFIGVFLYTQSLLAMVLFSLVCLKNTCSHETLWKEFFTIIKECDIKMGRIVEENVYKCYSKFVLGNMFYAVLHIFSYVCSVEGINLILLISMSYVFIMSLQVLITTLILDMIFSMLEKRYELLRRKTSEVLLFLNKDKTYWCSLKLKDYHLLLTNVTQVVNKLFGSKMLLLLILLFSNILGGFQYGVLEDLSFHSKNFDILFSIGTQFIFLWVSRYMTINSSVRK